HAPSVLTSTRDDSSSSVPTSPSTQTDSSPAVSAATSNSTTATTEASGSGQEGKISTVDGSKVSGSSTGAGVSTDPHIFGQSSSAPAAPTVAAAFSNATTVAFSWPLGAHSSFNVQIGTSPDSNNVFDGNVISGGSTGIKAIVGSS